MTFKKITETPSNHNDLEKKSVGEIISSINEEDHKVAAAVQKKLNDIAKLIKSIEPRKKSISNKRTR